MGPRGFPAAALLKIMVKMLAEKPDAFKQEQEGDVHYLLFDDAAPYAFACLNFCYPPIAMLHLEVRRFSHNILTKSGPADWAYLVNECKSNGCDMIHINTEGTLEQNAKFMKFVHYFGFKEFVQYIASTQHIGD